MATSDLPTEAREKQVEQRLALIRNLSNLTSNEAWAVVVELLRRAPADLEYLLKRVRSLEQENEFLRMQQAALPGPPPPRLPPPTRTKAAIRGEAITEEADPLRDISQALLELGDKIEAIRRKP